MTYPANSDKSQEAKDYIKRALNLHDQMEGIKADCAKKLEAPKEDLKDLWGEAKGRGFDAAVLKRLVKEKQDADKATRWRANQENDRINEYDTIKAALGDFFDTPLGNAAIEDLR